MITNISKDKVLVEKFGASPGVYAFDDFSAEDLMTELRIRIAGRLSGDDRADDLSIDDKIQKIIDDKCNEGGEL
jgi:hypothetical protein